MILSLLGNHPNTGVTKYPKVTVKFKSHLRSYMFTTGLFKKACSWGIILWFSDILAQESGHGLESGTMSYTMAA